MGIKVVRSALLAVVIGWGVSGKALAGAAIGATEPTQLLNNIQLVISYVEQVTTAAENVEQRIQEAENRVRGVLEAPYQIKQRLDDVRDTVRSGLGLAYSLQNLDQVFLDRYKDFDDFMQGYNRIGFSQDIRTWTQTTEDSIKNALEAAGIQMESLEEEENIMNQLYAKAQTTRGREQSLSLANEISAMNTRQMQSLRQLVATDMQIKAAYFQQQTAMTKATEAASGEFYQPTLTPDLWRPVLDNSQTHGFNQPGPAGAGAGGQMWRLNP